MSKFLMFVEVVLKFLVSVFGGAGAGMVVFGIGLMLHGVNDFRGDGPPPAPIFIGIGAGLLVTATAMLVLFAGPFSDRRWFAESNDLDPPLKKWKAAS